MTTGRRGPRIRFNRLLRWVQVEGKRFTNVHILSTDWSRELRPVYVGGKVDSFHQVGPSITKVVFQTANRTTITIEAEDADLEEVR